MRPLFRLDGCAARHPSVVSWLNEHDDEFGSIARLWFDTLRQSGEDVSEVLHDNQPTACVSGVAFAYVAVFTAHVNVGFFHGAELPDPAHLLQGSGKYMRHVKLRAGAGEHTTALKALIDAAYLDVRARLAAER